MRCPRTVGLAVIVIAAAGQQSIAAQGGIEALGGLGELIGSFGARTAYVGSERVNLRELRQTPLRVQLHGFSVSPPSGAGWYIAASKEPSADIVQTIWFVRDPHRFSGWAKGDRIPASPQSLIARLRFYGSADTGDVSTRVRAAKAAEWRKEGVRVLDLETRPSRLGDVQCAEYEGRIVDRRAPPGFVEQPFLVVLAGRVCPHPDAPSLVVDIGSARRTPEGAPLPAADSAAGAFIAGLALDAFRGPIVEAMLALRGDQELQARDQPFWIGGAAMGGGSLWLSHTPGTLSRVDPVSLRITAAVTVGNSPVAGFADGSLWGGGAALRAWRMDTASGELPDSVPTTCPASLVTAGLRPVHAGAFGVWLACGPPLEARRSSRPLPGVLRRLDTNTGAAVADIAVPNTVGAIQGDTRRVWVRDGDEVDGKTCRLHEIDVGANKLIRTLELGPFACRRLAIAGDEAWLLRDVKHGDEVVKVDLNTGRTIAAIPLVKGRFATELAIGTDAVWVSSTAGTDENASVLEPGSTGAVFIIDRASGRARGAMIPTGRAGWLIAVEMNTAWLYDGTGIVVRVTEHRSAAR